MNEIWVRSDRMVRRLRVVALVGILAAICVNFVAGCTNDQEIMDKHQKALEQEEE